MVDYRIPLPSSCEGCPFYQHGKYFTPDDIREGTEVLFIAQNPGPDEEKGRKLIERTWAYGKPHDTFEQVQPGPLIGATGVQFNERFLPLAQLKRSEVSTANAIRCRPGQSLGMPSDALPPITSKMDLDRSRADIVKALKHCRDTYLKVPSTTKLIVTMGRYALFSLTGIQNEENEYGEKYRDWETLRWGNNDE